MLTYCKASNHTSSESSALFDTMLTKIGCAYASPDLSNFLDAMYSTAAVAYQATEKAVNKARGAHYGVSDPYFTPKKLQSNVGETEPLEQTSAHSVGRDDQAEGGGPVVSSVESYTTLNVQFPPSFPDHRNKDGFSPARCVHTDHDREDPRFEDRPLEKQDIKNKLPLHSYKRQVPKSRLRET